MTNFHDPRKPLLPMLPPLTEEEAARAETENRQRYAGQGRRIAIQLGVLLLMLMSCGFGYYYSTRLPFDSVQWKAANSSVAKFDGRKVRRRMCDDLLRSQRLIGLDHFQVVALLGKPDQYRVHDWDMGYSVGNYYIGMDMLVIKFDGHKRVVECQILSVD